MSRPFAIVTGASSGIGFALAHELAQRGYDVAICSSGDRLSTAAADLRSTGALVFEFRAPKPCLVFGSYCEYSQFYDALSRLKTSKHSRLNFLPFGVLRKGFRPNSCSDTCSKVRLGLSELYLLNFLALPVWAVVSDLSLAFFLVFIMSVPPVPSLILVWLDQ
jgi:glycine/D-amino acid oxidase-like deaminating enzyme